ncbi:MAG: MMPL family transporter, partial [Phycisphaerales bacterium]
AGGGGGGAARPGPEFSRDGRALLLRIAATFSSSDLERAACLYDATRSLASEAGPGGLSVRIGGPHAIASVSSRTIRADAIRSTLLSVGAVLVLFAVFDRRWAQSLLVGATAGVGMLAGFGAFAAVSPVISPLAAVVAAMLAGLGVDYGIHLVSRYESLRESGLDPRESASGAVRHVALPVTTNCATSIFGFASLWFARVPMLSDFARLSALGLAGCLLCTFTLLPALLVITDRRPAGRAAPARFAFVAGALARRPRRLALGSLGLLGALVALAAVQGGVPRLESDLTVLHPRPNPALEATDEVLARFAGSGEVIPVLIRAPAADLLPAAIDAVASLSGGACREAGVADVLGLHSLLPDPRTAPAVREVLAGVDLDAALRAFDRALEESPFEPAAYRGYRDLLADILRPDPPPGMAELLRHPGVAERLFPRSGAAAPTETVLLVRLGRALREREARTAVVGAMRAALGDHPGATIAALAAVSEELEAATRWDLPLAVLVSTALVLAWLAVVFRRAADVALALTPLVFATVATVAFLTASGQRLNPVSCIAIPLLVGIAVDSGVFLVSASRGVRGAGELARELRPTVHAVLLTSATTVTGFAALGAVHTPAIRSLGASAAFGVGVALVGALGLLVPLLLARAARGARGSDPAAPLG